PVATPAGEARLELPGEVDRLLDAGVHAEAAGRRQLVRRIADQEDAFRAVAIRDQLAARPRHDRLDLEIEGAPDRALDRGAHVRLGELAIFAAADERKPPVIAA